MPMILKVTLTIYPHLNDFTGKLNFRLRISKPSYKNISMGLARSPIKILGFTSYDRTNKQTNKKTPKQRLQLYIYIDMSEELDYIEDM